MAIIHADPGGEPFFSLTAAQVITSGFYGDMFQLGPSNTAPTGRGSIYGYTSGQSSSSFSKWFPAGFAQYVAGMAQYATTVPVNSQPFAFQNAAALQCEVNVDASGKFFFTRNGTNLGAGNPTKSTVVAQTGWHYYEVKVAFATGATGSIELRVDGNVVLSLSSVQTATTVATADRVYFKTINPNQNAWYKDIYIIDPLTGSNTGYLGDISVLPIYPNAAGVNQAWTNVGGGSQTISVQDGISGSGTRPDGDTTYISSATLNQISDFAHQTLTNTGLIYAVAHLTYADKDDAGSRQFAQVCISGGTTEVSTIYSPGNTYAYFLDVLEKDPNTNLAWTVSNYNAATFGVKEIT